MGREVNSKLNELAIACTYLHHTYTYILVWILKQRVLKSFFECKIYRKRRKSQILFVLIFFQIFVSLYELL